MSNTCPEFTNSVYLNLDASFHNALSKCNFAASKCNVRVVSKCHFKCLVTLSAPSWLVHARCRGTHAASAITTGLRSQSSRANFTCARAHALTGLAPRPNGNCVSIETQTSREQVLLRSIAASFLWDGKKTRDKEINGTRTESRINGKLTMRASDASVCSISRENFIGEEFIVVPYHGIVRAWRYPVFFSFWFFNWWEEETRRFFF